MLAIFVILTMCSAVVALLLVKITWHTKSRHTLRWCQVMASIFFAIWLIIDAKSWPDMMTIFAAGDTQQTEIVLLWIVSHILLLLPIAYIEGTLNPRRPATWEEFYALCDPHPVIEECE